MTLGYVRQTAKKLLPPSVPNAVNDLESIQAHKYELPRILQSYYAPRKTIYFLPERPQLDSVAYKLSRLSGFAISVQEQIPYDVVFKVHDQTYKEPISSTQFEIDHVINGACTDISKNTVNDIFQEVFGYPLGVDPTRYEGEIVVKSNLNSKHDGSLVEGPLPPSDVQNDKTYQKAITNIANHRNAVVDYRVPIHGSQIPLVYLKYRPIESRFSNENDYVKIKKTSNVFTESEVKHILSFTRQMGIDFGEIDVLRDEDERIYIVDANSTPHGPPNGLDKEDHRLALTQLRKSFERFIQANSKQ